MELLSRKANLTQKAIIDGSVCYPNPGLARFSIAAIQCLGRLLFSEKACRLQLALMPKLLPAKMLYPDELKAYYLQDIPRIRKETLYTMYRTYMMQYTLKESIRNTTAQVMYWYGEKEMKYVKKSAALFKSYVPACEIYEARGCDHGYLALYLPEEWLAIAEPFFQQKE